MTMDTTPRPVVLALTRREASVLAEVLRGLAGERIPNNSCGKDTVPSLRALDVAPILALVEAAA